MSKKRNNEVKILCQQRNKRPSYKPVIIERSAFALAILHHRAQGPPNTTITQAICAEYK